MCDFSKCIYIYSFFIDSKSTSIKYDNEISFPTSSLSLSSKSWQDFKLVDVFNHKRGVVITSENQINGSIPYVSSSKFNNGIDNYITPPHNLVIYNNAITLNNNGSIGYCFYHPYEFIASSYCTVLMIRDTSLLLNKWLFNFLRPIIEHLKPKYSYGRKISNLRLEKEVISLPIKSKNKPDWDFMENYIKSLPYSSSI